MTVQAAVAAATIGNYLWKILRLCRSSHGFAELALERAPKYVREGVAERIYTDSADFISYSLFVWRHLFALMNESRQLSGAIFQSGRQTAVD
jgi:hypothetical protein